MNKNSFGFSDCFQIVGVTLRARKEGKEETKWHSVIFGRSADLPREQEKNKRKKLLMLQSTV